jgi:hypothetical protein
MADWQAYVQRVVERYRGRIASYEVWNEPYFSEIGRDHGQPGFFSGSVAQMLEMTRVARRVIDETDPVARLATPGFVNGVDRLELFLAGGGARLVDVIAYHFYAADASQFASQVDEVRAAMARHGVARLPLWNTECGCERRIASPPAGQARADPAADEQAADLMGQFLILGAAARIDRFYYYAWDNDLSGMVDRDGASNARAGAYTRVGNWLFGTRVQPFERLPGGVFRIMASRGPDSVVFAWSDAGAPLSSVLPPGRRVAAIEPLRGSVPMRTLSAMPVAIRLTGAPSA